MRGKGAREGRREMRWLDAVERRNAERAGPLLEQWVIAGRLDGEAGSVRVMRDFRRTVKFGLVVVASESTATHFFRWEAGTRLARVT